MAFAVFGPGALYLTRTDVTPSTPINIGYAQEFSLDEAGETKQLFGQNQYPLAAARGTIKATGKVKAAEVSGLAINAAFHGLSFNAGQLVLAQGEAGAIPGSPAYTVTVSHSATFDTDLGVIYAATGLPFTKVASGPTLGQYSVAAGVYTFAAADASAAVQITYAYTLAGSGGQTKTVSNQRIGSSPTFQLDYGTVLAGKNYYIRIFQAIASKLSSTFKLTDFMMPEIDFDIFANSAGNVYEVSYADVG